MLAIIKQGCMLHSSSAAVVHQHHHRMASVTGNCMLESLPAASQYRNRKAMPTDNVTIALHQLGSRCSHRDWCIGHSVLTTWF